MTRGSSPLLAILLGFVTAGCLADECEKPLARLVDEGVYESQGSLREHMAENTVTGVVREIDSKELVQPGRVVDAKLGRSFGFRYFLDCERGRDLSVPMTIRVQHPPLRKPGARKAETLSTWDNDAWGNHSRPNIHSGYRFDESWEMVPGRWTIQVVHRDRVLLERHFDVRADAQQK